jgi:hypothetical protein
VEILSTYGGAVGMNRTFLQSLPPDSILFTKGGSGIQDPQIKFRAVKTIAMNVVKNMTFHCGTLGTKLVIVSVRDDFGVTRVPLSGDTQFEVLCLENPSTLSNTATSTSAIIWAIYFGALLSCFGCALYQLFYIKTKKYLVILTLIGSGMGYIIYRSISQIGETTGTNKLLFILITVVGIGCLCTIIVSFVLSCFKKKSIV